MNSQISKLFGLVVILFGILIIWTTRWTVIDAKSLQNNPLNVRTLVQELRIKRGRILADNVGGARPLGPPAGRDLEPHVPDGIAVLAGGRLLDCRGSRARPASSCRVAASCAGSRRG